MGDETKYEALFLENLQLIERIAAALARRQGIAGADADDFVSALKLKIIEDGYAVFRKFRGESTMGTYLTVVIAMFARDYRVQRWGRWRPSAVARRLGPVAIRLEALVRRHGHTVQQAGEILRTSAETHLSDRDLAAILAKLPARAPLRPVEVGAEPLRHVQGGSPSDLLIDKDQQEWQRKRIHEVLDEAMKNFSADERLVLRLRFWEDMSIADIARMMRVEQKPLYRRIERLLADLRERLSHAGVTPEECGALVSEAGA